MNDLPDEFIEVLIRASTALTSQAYEITQEPEYNLENLVGKILKKSVERSLQDADVITGFVQRWKKAQEK